MTLKASFYIAQYPVLRTVQSALHFTSLTDLFTQTPSRLLWEASSHMLQLMREGCSYTYPPLSIARYSFIQLSVLKYIQISLNRFPPHIIAIVIDIDDCMPNRCLNGGTCIDLVGGYSCSCATYYSGRNCAKSKYTRMFIYMYVFCPNGRMKMNNNSIF